MNDVASVAATNVISGTAGNLRLFRLKEYKIRVGYPADKFMPYLSLGRGEMQQDFTCCDNSGAYSSTYKSIGIGVEYALGEKIFTGVEYTKSDWYYRHSNSTRQTNGDVKAVRLRLGYRF
jgi:opacity protein-like surface antigen